GITDGNYIEIKSGLTGNEEVYVVRTTSTTTDSMQGMPNFKIGVPVQQGNFQRSNQNWGGTGNYNGGNTRQGNNRD
ncbi:MAG TPA: hypothetical protein VN131_02245, partial [Mobilitalea sp.]|nr:hypothetical protein [Mobilitalea sp.]